MTVLINTGGLPDPAAVTIETVKGKGHVYHTPDGDFVGATTYLYVDGSGTHMLMKHAAKLAREGRDHEAEFKEAGAVGSEFHDVVACETMKRSGPAPLSDGAKRSCKHWRGWWTLAGLTPIAVEQPVWNKEHGYAGAIDLVCADSDGKVGIVDYKTGDIYNIIKHHRQLAAYFFAAKNFIHVDWALLVGCPRKKGEKMRIHELGQITGKKMLHPAKLFDSFLACKKIWEIDRGV